MYIDEVSIDIIPKILIIYRTVIDERNTQTKIKTASMDDIMENIF